MVEGKVLAYCVYGRDKGVECLHDKVETLSKVWVGVGTPSLAGGPDISDVTLYLG